MRNVESKTTITRGGRFLAAFGFGDGGPATSGPADSSRQGYETPQQLEVGEDRLDTAQSGAPISTPPRLLALDAEQHAAELLTWLTGPGGRTGTVSARDLAAAHLDMCAALEIEPLGWVAVGRELRRLLGEPKRYVDRGHQRVRAYRIPPAGAEPASRAAARWAQTVAAPSPNDHHNHRPPVAA